MPNPVQSAVRAVAESAVGLIAALNRKRLPKTGSPYLVGIHEPMRSELTLENLAVAGSIPAGLNGRYLKMGANSAKPDSAGHHWFLGDGMVHGITLRDGRALVSQPLDRFAPGGAALGRAAAPGPRRGRAGAATTP